MSKNLLKFCFAVSAIAAVVFASYVAEAETEILPTHTQKHRHRYDINCESVCSAVFWLDNVAGSDRV